MSARPPRSAAALLAALALILLSAVPASAARHPRVRAHASKANAMRWGQGWDRARARVRAHRRSRRPGGPRPTARGAEPKFGVFTDGSPYDGTVRSVDALQRRLGRRIDIVNWYQSWTPGSWVSQVHPEVLGAVTGSGRTPLLTWEPWDPAKGADQPAFSLRRLADGAYDSYVAQWADALKATGTDVYLRPMHEMNGNWYPWGAGVGDNTPELYVRAWRRLHDVFAARGATNVKWVWCPLPVSVPDTKATALERYYPGRQYVDVLSLDGYNWGAGHPEYGGWQSFADVFGAAYKRLTKLGPQPIWIAEVGSADKGGDKAKWVRDMWATARRMRRLEAVIWFDQDKEEDWRAAPVASAFARR